MEPMEQVTETEGLAKDWRARLWQDLFLLERFARRYGRPILVLLVAAVLGIMSANSVSNYTHGGWEIHIEQRLNQNILVNIHFHHWYYGLPLYLVALLLIDVQTDLSIFAFGFGQAVSAHSFINEGGIPSIIEGGATWRVPPEIYFPLITALALLYAFFLIRREEWLVRAKEREEIAVTYSVVRSATSTVLVNLNQWAAAHFRKHKIHASNDAHITYGEWRVLDRAARGEWQLHFVASPFDDTNDLLVVRIEHIPHTGKLGKLDDWIEEMDRALGADAKPVLVREQFAKDTTLDTQGGVP